MKPRRESIEEKSGASWLTSLDSEQELSGDPTPEMENTRRASGAVDAVFSGLERRIRQILEAAPNKTGELHHLVDVTGFDADTLFPVISSMESKGMIRVDREKYGNNTIRLIR